MPELEAAIAELKRTLGEHLERNRADGVFYVQIGGPGSVPTLADLDLPEIHLDVLPGELTEAQTAGLSQLGYLPAGEHWQHPGGWRLVLPDHTAGWRAEQKALRELLLADQVAALEYREAYQQNGRASADETFRDWARDYHRLMVGFGPAQFVAGALADFSAPWMFAGGLALDLHVGQITRPHDDLDVVISREAQIELQRVLHGWRQDACIGGTYQVWEPPLEPPHHQVHARHPDLPDVIMADFMFTDLSAGLWHYRRDPAITLPLEWARQVGALVGLPYLAPEAVLLFKSATSGGNPRAKDQTDFERVLPSLNTEERAWLSEQLERTNSAHPWLAELA